MRGLLIVVLVGCGRIAFDPSGTTDASIDALDCAPSGHDEDADLVDDTCDVCPHIADGAQSDQDGDRIGDVCDPEPTLARQRLMLFDPFTRVDGGTWTLLRDIATSDGEDLMIDARGTNESLRRPYTPGHDHVATSVTSTASSVSPTRLVSLFTGADGAVAGYYCELFDDGTTSLMFTYTDDGVTFLHDGSALVPTRVLLGSGTLAYERSATVVRCATTWGGTDLRTIGATPTSIPTDLAGLYVEHLLTRWEYYWHVRTDD